MYNIFLRIKLNLIEFHNFSTETHKLGVSADVWRRGSPVSTIIKN